MPVARKPRKKVEKKADKAVTVEKEVGVKDTKISEGKAKDNSRKRKASSPDVQVLTPVSHPSHGKVCQSCVLSQGYLTQR